MDNDKCRRFILLYKTHQLLWDMKHPQHQNRILRLDAWRSISSVLDEPASELKKKMTILLGSYRREKSRQKRSLLSGSGIYTSRWFAFDCFQFLSKNNSPYHEYSNEESTSEPTVYNIEMSTLLPTRNISERRASKSQVPRISKKSTPTKGSKIISDALKLKKNPANTSTDPYVSYGQYIANELRKYDPQTLAYVKKAINNVIFEADMGSCHSSTHEPSEKQLAVVRDPFNQEASPVDPTPLSPDTDSTVFRFGKTLSNSQPTQAPSSAHESSSEHNEIPIASPDILYDLVKEE